MHRGLSTSGTTGPLRSNPEGYTRDHSFYYSDHLSGADDSARVLTG